MSHLTPPTRAARLLGWLLALAALAAAANTPCAAADLPGDSVYRVEARLTDQDATTHRFADGAGEVRLATMFYASCGYVCPLLIEQIRRIEAQLDEAERARLRVLLISLDPERDTPEALAALAARRKLDTPRWTLAQPAAADLRELSAVLGVQYRKRDDGEFNHSSVITLLDAEGRVLAQTAQLGGEQDAGFIATLKQALAADASR
jgi:protein SCO1